MTESDWRSKATLLAPLLRYASDGDQGSEPGLIGQIFQMLPQGAGYAVELGLGTMVGGGRSALSDMMGWDALHLDSGAQPAVTPPSAPHGKVNEAAEVIAPTNVLDVFDKHGVPKNLDCLILGLHGQDYWVWEAVGGGFEPSLVIIEFNAHVSHNVEASIQRRDGWVCTGTRDYGASFAALCALAARKGYGLIHVHGPRNLYFLRNDIAFPSEMSVKQPLTLDEFAVLTDPKGFYDTFCFDAQPPGSVGDPAPDTSRAPWEILVPAPVAKQIDLEGLTFHVIGDKYDPTWYTQRKTYEEKASLLYRFIADGGFESFVDIGANVGFVSILAHLLQPRLRIIAVEADPRLAQLIRRNFDRHCMGTALIVNAVAGQHDAPSKGFSLNPTSTLDNRVHIDGWVQTFVPMVHIGRLLQAHELSGKAFIKVDTQGFEWDVLHGLEPWLTDTRKWVLKMEFAPDWLQSQSTDPLALLDYLLARYDVVEFPERIPFGTTGIDALFQTPVKQDQQARFLQHVKSLNKGGSGWVDLLLRPKQS